MEVESQRAWKSRMGRGVDAEGASDERSFVHGRQRKTEEGSSDRGLT
jgi:hypothetical protein